MSDRDESTGRRHRLWTLAVLAAVTPLLATLCVTIWRTPMPLSEAVALFEDVARFPASRFFNLDTSYYRPLYHLTLSVIWTSGVSFDTRLAAVTLLQIAPVVVLVGLFVWHLQPRTALDAAVATSAVAVLVASPAFRDNLELPLSYTTVGMPIVLAVWMLLNRPSGRWHTAAIVGLTLVAIGFKEQGLVIVPLVVAMWWAGAPGASRGTAASVAAIAVAYVALRLSQSGDWPLFQQAVGYGFGSLSPAAAETRFGAVPIWMFAYSSASTMANVLFSEPTAGVFRITRDATAGLLEPWAVIHVASSLVLTGLIAWWGIGALRRSDGHAWSPDLRLFVALIVVLAACGALSFNYSRDRLGGMAVAFYAIAAYHALRAVVARTLGASRPSRFALASLALLLLAGAWQIRAFATIETARVTSYRNRIEWLIRLPERRAEFADRPTYLTIMEAGVAQGTAASAPRPTRYPRAVEMFLHEP